MKLRRKQREMRTHAAAWLLLVAVVCLCFMGYWGAKGAMTTHMAFESGIASVIAYQRFNSSLPSEEQLNACLSRGFYEIFKDAVSEIDNLSMYDRFQKGGWTTTLAKQTNQILMPTIIRTVALAWLSALDKSRGTK